MAAERTSVLVLLVASNAEPWLPEVVEGVRSQTWPHLDVLAVDNASTDATPEILLTAFGTGRVVRLERRVGYGRALAAALKVAVERGAVADAFLLLHDDAAMEPEAVEAMVEALGRDRVGIVGAKLVEWDAPDILQEVGLTTDRFGRLYNPLERGELDQGQHDGLREVFHSSSACLLVARSIVERVGLFDLRYVALRDDYDLCWRARLAGSRTVVTSEARVRHAALSYRGVRGGVVEGRTRYFSDRNMIASLLKNYSLPSLFVALPVTVVVSIINAVLFAFTGRRRFARQTLAALQWNLVHLPSTLRARARAQRRRSVRDRDVAKLMVRGAPRVRSYLERALEQVVGEPAIGIDEELPATQAAGRKRLSDRIRAHPLVFASLVLLTAYLVGVRGLFGPGGLAGEGMAPFPSGSGEFFREFFSGWRSAGAGGAAPATPALFLGGVLSFLSFGSTWLAERIVFLSLLPLAAGAASRLGGALGLSVAARRAAAMLYGLSPLALAAFGEGRLTDLAIVASLPALLIPVLRAAGLADPAGWRSLASGAVGLALVASVSPWALPAVAGTSLVAVVAALVAGIRREEALAGLAAGFGMTVAAVALLLPWSIELFRPGSPIGGATGPLGTPLTDLVRLVPHGTPVIPGPVAWAFPVLAALGYAIAPPERERLARTLAILAGGAVLVSWAVARGVPWVAPRPMLPLTAAAIPIVLLAALGLESVVPVLSARSFGPVHVVSGLLVSFGIVAVALGGWFVARGDYRGVSRSGALTPAFFSADHRQLGDFRVLWLAGTQRSLRADLSGPEGETALTLGTRRAGAGERYLERTLASVMTRRTEEAGRLLAPLGVRYVVIRPGTDASVATALARQTDLAFAQRFRGADIIGNRSWLSVGATIASPQWIAASRVAAVEEAGSVASVPDDPERVSSLRHQGPARMTGRTKAPARLLTLAHAYSRRWRATVGGRALTAAPSFGWATSFPLPEAAPGSPPQTVQVAWRGNAPHRLAIFVQALLWLGVAAAWSMTAARERGER